MNRLALVVAVVFLNISHFVNCDVGGHDLFSSLAQLEVLWKNDVKIVETMENMAEKLENASMAIKQ